MQVIGSLKLSKFNFHLRCDVLSVVEMCIEIRPLPYGLSLIGRGTIKKLINYKMLRLTNFSKLNYRSDLKNKYCEANYQIKYWGNPIFNCSGNSLSIFFFGNALCRSLLQFSLSGNTVGSVGAVIFMDYSRLLGFCNSPSGLVCMAISKKQEF